MENEQKTIEILEKYNQNHVVEHMKNIDNIGKEKLIAQVMDINFEEITNLYNNVQTKKEKKCSDIKPINTIIKNNIGEEEKNNYIQIGEKVLKNNIFAVVTMAGGQGTRLRT